MQILEKTCYIKISELYLHGVMVVCTNEIALPTLFRKRDESICFWSGYLIMFYIYSCVITLISGPELFCPIQAIFLHIHTFCLFSHLVIKWTFTKQKDQLAEIFVNECVCSCTITFVRIYIQRSSMKKSVTSKKGLLFT